MRLSFVADARAQRQVPADPDVVLQVEAGLYVRVGNVRIARAFREAPRSAQLELSQALERVGPDIVRPIVRAVRSRVQLQAGADRVDAAHVVEIRKQVERLRPHPALPLLPSAVER